MSDQDRTAIRPIDDVQSFHIGREAVITISPSTGMVCVSTTYHRELNGMTYWCHRGEETLVQFLIGCQAEYVIRKLFDQRLLKEFDEEGTVRGLKETIIEMRRYARQGDLRRPSAREARDWWDEVCGITCGEEVMELDFIDCQYEYILEKETSAVGYFARMIWAPFIAHLKAMELARTAAVAP